MTELTKTTVLHQIYKCPGCTMTVEVLHGADCTLSCCGETMKLLVDNTVDASREKHLPVIEQTAEGLTVTVGSVLHPMEEKHYIEWIEVLVDGKAYRQFLHPGDAPVAFFPLQAATLAVRELCNLHGVWKTEAGL